jgi:hypothetical protein
MVQDPIQNGKKKIHERPLDPTRDAEDLLGDPTGRAGVTTGDPKHTSAEADEVDKDGSAIRGGEIDDPQQINPTGVSLDSIDDEADDAKTFDGMSDVRAAVNNDLATEEETLSTAIASAIDPDDDPMEDDEDYATPISKNAVSADHDSGEDDAAGGTAADPASDDDVGEMMKRVTGEDPDPDMDNPQELGLGEKIDEDEEAIRES